MQHHRFQTVRGCAVCAAFAKMQWASALFWTSAPKHPVTQLETHKMRMLYQRISA